MCPLLGAGTCSLPTLPFGFASPLWFPQQNLWRSCPASPCWRLFPSPELRWLLAASPRFQPQRVPSWSGSTCAHANTTFRSSSPCCFPPAVPIRGGRVQHGQAWLSSSQGSSAGRGCHCVPTGRVTATDPVPPWHRLQASRRLGPCQQMGEAGFRLSGGYLPDLARVHAPTQGLSRAKRIAALGHDATAPAVLKQQSKQRDGASTWPCSAPTAAKTEAASTLL